MEGAEGCVLTVYTGAGRLALGQWVPAARGSVHFVVRQPVTLHTNALLALKASTRTHLSIFLSPAIFHPSFQ